MVRPMKTAKTRSTNFPACQTKPKRMRWSTDTGNPDRLSRECQCARTYLAATLLALADKGRGAAIFQFGPKSYITDRFLLQCTAPNPRQDRRYLVRET